MKTRAVEGTLGGSYSNRIAESVENLLIDHVRDSFLKDEKKLESIRKDVEEIQVRAQLSESRLKELEESRIAKHLACLERLSADCEKVSGEIQNLDADRIGHRSLLDRGKAKQWLDTERASAKSSADAALFSVAAEIVECEKRIETLRTRLEQHAQAIQVCVHQKNDSEELLLSLTSDGTPQAYRDALTKEADSLEAGIQRSSGNVRLELAEKRTANWSAKAALSKLKQELKEARDHQSRLDSAHKVKRFLLRINPLGLLRRSIDVIWSDIQTQQGLERASQSAVGDLEAKLDGLSQQHKLQLESLPGEVRKKLIGTTLAGLADVSERIDNLRHLSEEVSTRIATQQGELDEKKGRYAEDHQRHLEAHFADKLLKAGSELAHIETCIHHSIELRGSLEVKRERLTKIIERRREKLACGLLDLQSQAKSQTDQFEPEACRLRHRLRDRASRAGMVYDTTADRFRTRSVVRSSTQGSHSFRRTGAEPSPMCTLPILLQRRLQTGYSSKDDERLCSVIASLIREGEPPEEDRADYIDRFCDYFFGDDEDERSFLVSFVSKDRGGVLALIRPTTLLPQLQRTLPEAMSICVLCRLLYNEKKNPDNTTLTLLDCALVPNCESRPFERNVNLVRFSVKGALQTPSHPLDELLNLANASLPVLVAELGERLEDWKGYLDWADELLIRKAPWAVLGAGSWKGNSWEGLIFCSEKRIKEAFTGAGESDSSRPQLEIYLLGQAWQQLGLEGNARLYRCADFRVLSEEPADTAPRDCPWQHKFPLRVRMAFDPEDASSLVSLTETTPIGVRDISKQRGSRTQSERYRTALEQLQTLVPVFDRQKRTKRVQFNRLSASPYLMAYLFNVSQAAPAVKTGGLLKDEIVKRYRLNEDQGKAVEVMLSVPEIAYIQGPPGTGKTTMIAAACAHFVRSGKRVLISAQTNLAIENALERLFGDPEIRPLWLSGKEGEQKRSAAIADWYRMASNHVESAVISSFRTLSDEVGGMQNWLQRARKLNIDRIEISSDVQRREEDLIRAQASLAEVSQIQKAASEAKASMAWWTMVHDALAKGEDWDDRHFSHALKSDVIVLLELLAKFDKTETNLTVSSHALNRQAREHIKYLQSRLLTGVDGERDEEAVRIQRQILEEWPAPTLHLQGPSSIEEQQLILSRERAEVEGQRAQQALEAAQVRAREMDEKARSLLSEIRSFLDLPEVATNLPSAIDAVERHADLQGMRLDDIKPLKEWMPLLDQWVADLRERVENPPATDRMGERYVRNANVIGVTCNSDFKILADSGSPRFDVVIIDEVSKATPLELLRPMLLGPKTILVGDHRQLPPTFEFGSFGASERTRTEDEDQEALDREAELLHKYERMNTASLFRSGFEEIDPSARAALYTQYRMHPDIMQLVNRFYDGQLKSGLVDPDGLDDGAKWSWRMHGLSLNSRTGGYYLTPRLHALWIDSSVNENGEPAYEATNDAGIANELEARLVAQIVEDIADACDRDQQKKTIAVATFYNRQKSLIKEMLDKNLGRRIETLQIDVETVDRFQGKEADIVVVSMVRNKSPRSGRLGRNSNPAKFERINVAFSRARDLLIVVGARKTFERFDVAIEPVDGGPPRRTFVYGEIIEDVKEMGGLWGAKDILAASSSQSGNQRA